MVSMNVVVDAIMNTDSDIIKLVDDALLRKSVVIDQSRFVDRVICTGTTDKKLMLVALRIMSAIPVSDLVSILSPIYDDHFESIAEIFNTSDAKSEANFGKVIRSINGNRLISNSLNDKTLLNLKKALEKEDE